MTQTETFKLQEIMSGREEDYLWVTIGFSSPERAADVLHVVVARQINEQDRALGLEGVYLERYDQSLSCYAGATSIRASRDRVEVALTETGQAKLGLPPELRFEECHVIQGYGDAFEVFAEMSELPCGQAVSARAS